MKFNLYHIGVITLSALSMSLCLMAYEGSKELELQKDLEQRQSMEKFAEDLGNEFEKKCIQKTEKKS
jgi:hypothetical protein